MAVGNGREKHWSHGPKDVGHGPDGVRTVRLMRSGPLTLLCAVTGLSDGCADLGAVTVRGDVRRPQEWDMHWFI